MGQQQQTILRVQTNFGGFSNYVVLDTYSAIPIKVQKSYAELQDVTKKNTDYTINFQIPGSKTNNAFFNNFFDVDTQSF